MCWATTPRAAGSAAPRVPWPSARCCTSACRVPSCSSRARSRGPSARPVPRRRRATPATCCRPRHRRPALPSALIGNGSYTVCLRPNGAGQSRWRGLALNRSRDDLLRDAHGHWLLWRPVGATALHSLTSAPLPAPQTTYRTRLYPDHVEFDAESDTMASTVTVWVSSDDDVELRRIVLHNRSDEAIDVELMSVFEVALAPQAADESHPAFSNLFVRAQAIDIGGLMFERRPRRHDERGVWMAHFLAASDVDPDGVTLACDRARLWPRGGTLGQIRVPSGAAVRPGQGIDTGLDPVAALAVQLHVPPHARRCLTVGTAAAEDAKTLMSIVDEYRQEVHLTRSSLMAATLARIRQREWQVSAPVLHLAQDLTTRLLMTPLQARTPPAAALDRRALWRFGVSGDRPILLVRIDAAAGLRAVRALLNAQRLWTFGGLVCDLVIVNHEPPSYLMPLQRRLLEVFGQFGVESEPGPDRPRTLALRRQEVSAVEWAALRAFARCELHADGRAIDQWMTPVPDPAEATDVPEREPAAQPWPDGAVDCGFAEQGRAFEIHIDAHRVTPRPWANVLANPRFGCIVTESGGGHTWARNSRLHQLTPWTNDPLIDPPAEHFLVRDEDSGLCFGLLPTMDRNGSHGYRVSHRAGMSDFVQERPGLAIDTRVMVHPEAPAKCLRVRLRNLGDAPRRLRLLGLVEWVLGAQRRDRMTLQTQHQPDLQAVMARQLDHSGGHGDGTAFLMLVGATIDDWTCDRQAFFDRRGRLGWPKALGQTEGFGLDPCAALTSTVSIAPGATLQCHWVIGHESDREGAAALARRMREPGALDGLPDAIDAHWDALLGQVTVHTPDPLFDALVNRWLLYQTVACRLWAKAGFYQVSGATGFRDQLQDTLALATIRPDLLRAQLLTQASRQYGEGDVQHWWHEPGGAGVRTHSSDDLLWLPFATTHYLQATDDSAVLDATVPFLEGASVPPGAEDVYEVPTVSAHAASLYEHGARAIDRALRFGAHGLPLMGAGDWNDGMNRVGHDGRGESVWLGWFLLVVLRDWLPLAERRGDLTRSTRWHDSRAALDDALARHGWDGAWYRRAYFDNGHPLGSHLNDEARIDLIAQAWSVFASPPGDERARMAMHSADERLVDPRHGLVRLLDPPLQAAADNAGYIQAYPPGVRENGGQYSHAAVWALMAQARLGHADKAWAYFCMISPAHRTRTPADRQRYAIEPYVLPGDIYSAPPYVGRGGWSWYTGSAAWLHRAAVESLFGLSLHPGRLRLTPALPPLWPQARLHLRQGSREIDILLLRDDGASPQDAADARSVAPGEWVEIASLPARARLRVVLRPGERIDGTQDSTAHAR